MFLKLDFFFVGFNCHLLKKMEKTVYRKLIVFDISSCSLPFSTRRSRRRSYIDTIKLCDVFLNKERRHTEDTYPSRHKSRYVFRERSIDDGSHFDPRLDKYVFEEGDNSIRRREKYGHKSVDRNDTLKSEKKLGGLEKVTINLGFFSFIYGRPQMSARSLCNLYKITMFFLSFFFVA